MCYGSNQLDQNEMTYLVLYRFMVVEYWILTGSWSFWTDIKLSLVLCCFISIKWQRVPVTTFCLFIFCLYLPDGVSLQNINGLKEYFHMLNLLQKKQLPLKANFHEDYDCSPSFKGTFIFFWMNDLKSYLSRREQWWRVT